MSTPTTTSPSTSRRVRTLRHVLVAVTLALLALGAAAPAQASLDPLAGSAPPGQQQPRPDAPHGETCLLRDPGASEHDEFGQCLTVDASLSRAPGLGRSATLSYEVRSAVARPDAEVTVELPEELAFARLPAGAASSRLAGRSGPITAATATADLSSAGTERFSTSVRAVEAGPVEVVVRVSAPRPDGGVDAAEDRVFLTVGDDGEASRLAVATPTTGGTAPAPEGVAPSDAVPDGSRRAMPLEAPVPAAQARAAAGDAALGAVVCVSGGWAYNDSGGVLRQAENFGVQVYDVDSASGRDLIGSGVTNYIGRFDICYDNADSDEGGLVDPQIVLVASNARYRIRNTPSSNVTYTFERPASYDQSGNVTVGNLTPTDANGMRVVQAFDAITDFWYWIPSNCWDANDASAACRQIVVNWTPTSTDGTFYSLSGNDIHLKAADPDSRHVVIHEATHAVMDDVYEDAYPDHPNCSPHDINAVSSAGCAWTEGFAEWVPASVLRDPAYRFPSGGFVPLEEPSWDTPNWGIGLVVEGRVAGAMIDIEDAANEGPWDRWSETGMPRSQWTTFLNASSPAPSYYVAFEYDRRQQGFNVSDDVRSAVFQNTINMAYWEPLADRAELLRPTPVPHNYHFDTTAPSWSAVGIRPAFGADYDLTLYDSRNGFGLLDASEAPAGTPDYLVVDSRRQPLGDFYPKVSAISGSGAYQVEWAQSGGNLADGTQTLLMGTGDVVALRDTLLQPGVPTYFRVVPGNGTQNVELLLHSGNTAWTSPVQRHELAVKTASARGLGGTEELVHSATSAEWAGLVLVNKEGSGSYTVYRDTTAPTGSVVINGGAASTSSRTVTHALAGADAQTGVDRVQISTDGVLDTEPVQAYSSSKSVTFGAGGGATKTVLVRYFNRAGQPSSATISDTISWVAPDLRVTASSNPPSTKADGTSFGVTDSSANRGTAVAPASTTRYYLSTNTTKDTPDRLLTGARPVPQLAAGATSTGAVNVTIPVGVPAGTYYLLACADDGKVVSELGETNNCRASTTTIRVT